MEVGKCQTQTKEWELVTEVLQYRRVTLLQ